jgi:hypothetical protein
LPIVNWCTKAEAVASGAIIAGTGTGDVSYINDGVNTGSGYGVLGASGVALAYSCAVTWGNLVPVISITRHGINYFINGEGINISCLVTLIQNTTSTVVYSSTESVNTITVSGSWIDVVGISYFFSGTGTASSLVTEGNIVEELIVNVSIDEPNSTNRLRLRQANTGRFLLNMG